MADLCSCNENKNLTVGKRSHTNLKNVTSKLGYVNWYQVLHIPGRIISKAPNTWKELVTSEWSDSAKLWFIEGGTIQQESIIINCQFTNEIIMPSTAFILVYSSNESLIHQNYIMIPLLYNYSLILWLVAFSVGFPTWAWPFSHHYSHSTTGYRSSALCLVVNLCFSFQQPLNVGFKIASMVVINHIIGEFHLR